MAETVTRIRIFVASPSDVTNERQRLREIIDEINRGVADHRGLVLQFVGWETDTWPDFGEEAQDVINRQIGQYDIFIGIMWKKFGTPTLRAGSGTEEEFRIAHDLYTKHDRPKIMFYFNTQPFFPESTSETEQFNKVLAFRQHIADLGGLYWRYTGVDDFAERVRDHLLKVVLTWESQDTSEETKSRLSLPYEFYQELFKELGGYISTFEQLTRDYARELRDEQLIFAVDFSEVYSYMYPSLMLGAERGKLNRYILDHLSSPFTLMPGAVGELLTNLEKVVPPPEVLDFNPLKIHESVAAFVNSFPRILSDEELVIKLYGQAEMNLRQIWGTLFDFIVSGHHTGLDALKRLIDGNRLIPVQGIQQLLNTPLTNDVRKRSRIVSSALYLLRPEKTRNNQIDTIDFTVTWLMNSDVKIPGNNYLSIFTQSTSFMQACAKPELRWEDDYLFRDAMYFKFRTRLEEIRSTLSERYNFVRDWAGKCRHLQRELATLVDLEQVSSKLTRPSLRLIDQYREFDQECRIPLIYIDSEQGNETMLSRRERLKEAETLYNHLKAKDQTELSSKTEKAYDVLIAYFRDILTRVESFGPDIHSEDAEGYLKRIADWLELEEPS